MEQRKSVRLPKYDYSQQGVYFVTFCTQNTQYLLWNPHLVGARIARPPNEVPLSQIGKIVQTSIDNIPVHYPGISVDISVIMPNHVHLLLRIAARGGRAMRAPTISRVINQLKGVVTKQIGYSIWQRSFYDHIIRDDADYAARYDYILDNPRRWAEDEYFIP